MAQGQLVKPLKLTKDDRQLLIDALRSHITLERESLVNVYADLVKTLPGETVDNWSKLVNWIGTLSPRQVPLGFIEVLKTTERANELIKQLGQKV